MKSVIILSKAENICIVLTSEIDLLDEVNAVSTILKNLGISLKSNTEISDTEDQNPTKIH